MSDDPIKLVRSLIDSGKGDIERLRYILDALCQGRHLDDSDKNYLQAISMQSDLEATTNADSVSDISQSNEDKPQEIVSSPSNDMPDERKGGFSKSPSRKKIVTVAAILGIIVVAYIGLDVYAVSGLQFRPHHGNQYMISPTQLFIQADVCNPFYFPASFSKYEINAFYKSQSIEKAKISGSTISPKTYAVLDGEFDLNQDAVMKLQGANEQFDPAQARITTTVDAPIFGVIPFSVEKQYAAEKFQQILKNGTNENFSCE